MRLVNRFCFAVLAGLVLVGSALGARDPGPRPPGRAAPPSSRTRASTPSQPRSSGIPRGSSAAFGRCASPRCGRGRASSASHRQIAAEPGIVRVERATTRRSLDEPALVAFPTACPTSGSSSAVRADQVPPAVARAAAAVTIAVIDTGADLTAPDLSAKAPQTYSVRTRQADVPDTTATARSSPPSPPARRRTATGSPASAATRD